MNATPAGRHRGLLVGHPFGVPVVLAPSWVVATGIVTWALAPVFGDYATAAVTALLVAVSVLAHDVGHAVVAARFGIPIRRITLRLVGGAIEIDREPQTPAAEYLVAVAGPLASTFIAGAA